jgi:S1-C subfamily serine protease
MAPYSAVFTPASERMITFTSGTGFFINNNQIVTNDHVVQDCKSIRIRGDFSPASAELVLSDDVDDLALLTTSHTPNHIAPLRGENPVSVGEHVVVMGYPLENGINGSYSIKHAQVTDVKDAFNNEARMQFTDSVQKGNSGGPLMDRNGTVVGVVVGKMSFYLSDAAGGIDKESDPIKRSGIAINLPTLKKFLKRNNIYYKTDDIDYRHTPGRMESKARDYIVNVHCIKS